MENKKKTIFNVIFLLVVFAGTMDMFSVFIGWILLQLYHTFGIWRTAGTDLLYEKRKDTNTGFDAGADDRYDHL